MKKVFLLSLAAVGMMAVSCKKGPIKPGKLEGTWNVSSYTSNQTTDNGNNSSSSTDVTFDGTVMTIENSQTQGGTTTTNTTEREYTQYDFMFAEDGTITITQMYTQTDETVVQGIGTYTTVTEVTSTQTGLWNVSNKYNDTYLANERLSLDITGETYDATITDSFIPAGGGQGTSSESSESEEMTYPDGSNVMLIQVTEFDKESMTAEQDLGYTSSDSQTSGGTTTTNSTTVTGSATWNFSKVGE